MKKTAIIFMSLLLSASMLASCAKPIDDNGSDMSDSETLQHATDAPPNETENNITNGDQADNGNTNDNNGGENNGGENNNDNEGGGEGEVVPPSEFPEPQNASIYSGTPDTSWYDESNPQSEYVLTTADQLMGLNKLRQDSAGAINFEGITVKLGADMVFNRGTMQDILASDDNDPWVTVSSDYKFLGLHS